MTPCARLFCSGNAVHPLFQLIVAPYQFLHERREVIGYSRGNLFGVANTVNAAILWIKRITVSGDILRKRNEATLGVSSNYGKAVLAKMQGFIDVAVSREEQPFCQSRRELEIPISWPSGIILLLKQAHSAQKLAAAEEFPALGRQDGFCYLVHCRCAFSSELNFFIKILVMLHNSMDFSYCPEWRQWCTKPTRDIYVRHVQF